MAHLGNFKKERRYIGIGIDATHACSKINLALYDRSFPFHTEMRLIILAMINCKSSFLNLEKWTNS
jgi:hypothetical protein